MAHSRESQPGRELQPPPYMPLSLEGDGDMLNIIRDQPCVYVAQPWVEQCNLLIDSAPEDLTVSRYIGTQKMTYDSWRIAQQNATGRAARMQNELYKAFGWTDSAHRLFGVCQAIRGREGSRKHEISPRNSIEVLRFLYKRTGEHMLDVLAAQFKVLFVPIDSIRRDEESFVARNMHSGAILNAPQVTQNATHTAGYREKKKTPSQGGTADRLISEGQRRLKDVSPEQRRRLEELAAYVRGGLDVLVTLPAILGCPEKLLNEITERAAEAGDLLAVTRIRFLLREAGVIVEE